MQVVAGRSAAHVSRHRKSFADGFDKERPIIAFVGPLGSGKSTIIYTILDYDAQKIGLVRSTTTRQPRLNKEGILIDHPKEYRYLTRSKFDECEANGFFAWTTPPILEENRYGTMIADIELGLKGPWPSLMHLRPDSVPDLLKIAGNNLALFFVNVEEAVLRRRIIERDGDTPATQSRIEVGLRWMAEAPKSGFPYIFVDNSHSLDNAVTRVINETRARSSHS